MTAMRPGGNGGGATTLAALTDIGAMGLSLGQSEDLSDVLAALGAYQSIGDTGWTDTGTVAHAGGVCSLGVVASGDAAALRPTPVDPLAPGVELVGRLDYTTGVPATDAWTYLAITNTARDRGYLVQVTYLGEVQMYSNVAGGGWAFATGTGGGAVDLTANTAWLRLVVAPSYVATYYATGASRPARDGWTRLGSAAINTELLSHGALDRVMLGAGRSAAGAGTYTAAWSDVAYRALLGLVA